MPNAVSPNPISADNNRCEKERAYQLELQVLLSCSAAKRGYGVLFDGNVMGVGGRPQRVRWAAWAVGALRESDAHAIAGLPRGPQELPEEQARRQGLAAGTLRCSQYGRGRTTVRGLSRWWVLQRDGSISPRLFVV